MSIIYSIGSKVISSISSIVIGIGKGIKLLFKVNIPVAVGVCITLFILTFYVSYTMIVSAKRTISNVETEVNRTVINIKRLVKNIGEGDTDNNLSSSRDLNNNFNSLRGNSLTGMNNTIQLTYGSLSEKQLKYLQEYISIMNEACNSAEPKVPLWLLIGQHSSEKDRMFINNTVKLPSTGLPIDKYNTKRADGTFINLTNLTEDDVKNINDNGFFTNDGKYKGAFQLSIDNWYDTHTGIDGNGDGIYSPYNLKDAAFTAASVLRSNKKQVEEVLGETAASWDMNSLWLFAGSCFHQGTSGMFTRFPKDKISEYNSMIKGMTTNRELFDNYTRNFYLTTNTSQGWNGTLPHVMASEYWINKNGWKPNKTLYDFLVANNAVLSSVEFVTNGDFTEYPGFSAGNGGLLSGFGTRKTTGGGNVGSLPEKYAVWGTEPMKNGFINKEENMYYIINQFIIGKFIEGTSNFIISKESSDSVHNSVTNGTNRPGSKTSVAYYWEYSSLLKLSGVVNDVNLKLASQSLNSSKLDLSKYFNTEINIADKNTYSGNFYEVGWKNNYPIMSQTIENGSGSGSFKFGDSSSTLSDSGCSVYTFVSMIHGIGLGKVQVPVPQKYTTKESSGLNEKGFIDVKKVANMIDSGPLTYLKAEGLGYKIKTMPTNTEDDIRNLWEEWEKGIPYAVNVRAGIFQSIGANGEVVNAQLTTGGHYILIVNGFEMNGRKYFEVVDSSNSLVGTKNPDSNRIYYDLENAINKDIFKSSGGYSVPAYTILGLGNLDNSVYSRLLEVYNSINESSESDDVILNTKATVEVVDKSGVKTLRIYNNGSLDNYLELSNMQTDLSVGTTIQEANSKIGTGKPTGKIGCQINGVTVSLLDLEVPSGM